MKRSQILLFTLCLVLSFKCSISKDYVQKCDENIEFKNEFMKQVNFVETYTMGGGKRIEFDEALIFLSKYVHVSYENMMNFSNSYTNLAMFNKDKQVWMTWYEDNKCNNIQFK